jgi:hypothetical protein
MSKIAFHDFPPGQVDSFRDVCDRYGYSSTSFHVEATVHIISIDDSTPSRTIAVRYIPSNLSRTYHADATGAWLAVFSTDLANHVF